MLLCYSNQILILFRTRTSKLLLGGGGLSLPNLFSILFPPFLFLHMPDFLLSLLIVHPNSYFSFSFFSPLRLICYIQGASNKSGTVHIGTQRVPKGSAQDKMKCHQNCSCLTKILPCLNWAFPAITRTDCLVGINITFCLAFCTRVGYKIISPNKNQKY